MKRSGLAILSIATLALGASNWGCAGADRNSPIVPSTGGSGGSSASGGSGGATSSGGSGGSAVGSGSGGSGGTSVSGGSGGSSSGGSGGSGGSSGSPDAAVLVDSGPAAGPDGGGGAPDGGGGGGGGDFKLTLVGLDETHAKYMAPVFPAAMSRPMQHSPAMMWSGAPAGAKSFAISMIDTTTAPKMNAPVAAGNGKKVHFTIYDIPVTATGLPADLPDMATLTMPAAKCSISFENRHCWFGPGGGLSIYVITVWALDVETLGLAASAGQQPSYDAIAKHSLGKAEFIAVGKNGGGI
jgi:phosphatidylethanolamine-binding protein (PEBP) family uncharacterized protein